MAEHPYLWQRSYTLHKGEVLSPTELHKGRRDYQDTIQGNEHQEEYGGEEEGKASFDEWKIMKQSKGMATRAVVIHTVPLVLKCQEKHLSTENKTTSTRTTKS